MVALHNLLLHCEYVFLIPVSGISQQPAACSILMFCLSQATAEVTSAEYCIYLFLTE